MAKAWAKQFYDSKGWKRCRDGYIHQRIVADGGLCECCHARLGSIVHHKDPLTPSNIRDPEVALNWENLSYECLDCHNQHEGHGLKPDLRRQQRRSSPVCRFDADGNPTEIKKRFLYDRL